VRFKEHIQAINGNKDASMFAQHILKAGRACGCREVTVTILHSINKSAHVIILGKLYIYEITTQGTKINYTFADVIYPIFDTLKQTCKMKQV
jgi:hypothetical protein